MICYVWIEIYFQETQFLKNQFLKLLLIVSLILIHLSLTLMAQFNYQMIAHILRYFPSYFQISKTFILGEAHLSLGNLQSHCQMIILIDLSKVIFLFSDAFSVLRQKWLILLCDLIWYFYDLLGYLEIYAQHILLSWLFMYDDL